jgi:hypothetical protein
MFPHYEKNLELAVETTITIIDKSTLNIWISSF